VDGIDDDPKDVPVTTTLGGITLFCDEPDTSPLWPAWVECLRAAQRMRRRGCSSIALVPASSQIGAVGVGLNLAVALRDVTGERVGYIDANLRWPALSKTEGKEGLGADVAPTEAYSQRWLRRDVAIFTPRKRVLGGAGLVPLQQLLATVKQQFAYCVVDLTGWKRLGEHLPAFDLIDGVAVVAKAGVTTELELLRFSYEIPSERYLGILLTGAEHGAMGDVVS
jgi:hypothetical protein